MTTEKKKEHVVGRITLGYRQSIPDDIDLAVERIKKIIKSKMDSKKETVVYSCISKEMFDDLCCISFQKGLSVQEVLRDALALYLRENSEKDLV